jgi:hypothetical protein
MNLFFDGIYKVPNRLCKARALVIIQQAGATHEEVRDGPDVAAGLSLLG